MFLTEKSGKAQSCAVIAKICLFLFVCLLLVFLLLLDLLLIPHHLLLACTHNLGWIRGQPPICLQSKWKKLIFCLRKQNCWCRNPASSIADLKEEILIFPSFQYVKNIVQSFFYTIILFPHIWPTSQPILPCCSANASENWCN